MLRRGVLADYATGVDRADALAIDIETKDPDLKKLGSGARRKNSHIAGISLAAASKWEVIWSSYFPVGHAMGHNEPVEKVARYVQDRINAAKVIVGANLIYDLDFITEKLGIDLDLYNVGRRVYVDVQHAESLIDENKRGSYSLEDIAQHYLGQGKDESLYERLAEMFGGKPTRAAQITNVWRAPAEVSLEYATQDAELPLRIYAEQRKILAGKRPDSTGKANDLREVWLLERDLFPLTLAMKQRGVRVDREAAEKAQRGLTERFEEVAGSFREDWGIANPQSSADIARWCDEAGVEYDRTDRGAPSIRKQWLERMAKSGEHCAFFADVLRYRRLAKNNGTFVSGVIKHATENDRIHCSFHPLKADEGGAVSGRYSSSDPNLQNQPSRDPEMASIIRGLFVPDPGHLWGTADYSQIEYRLLIARALQHLPKGSAGYMAAQKMKERFVEGKRKGVKVDVHQETAELCSIMRQDGKTINFGIVYGLGVDSLVEKLGHERDTCLDIIRTYNERAPYANEMYRHMQKLATRFGQIRTIGNRVRRFTMLELFVPWEWPNGEIPPEYVEFMELQEDKHKNIIYKRKRKVSVPMFRNEQEAIEHYTGVVSDPSRLKFKRAKVHTALNAELQGSAADILKRAMLDIWEAGLCDPSVLGAPLLTVHDELDWSVPPDQRDAFEETIRIMEQVYSDRLNGVPLEVDSALGANWAECK